MSLRLLAEADLAPHHSTDARQRAVLVVDDHPSVRDALGLILEEEYQVLFVEDGPSALQLLSARRVDAVLLDLGLPAWMGSRCWPGPGRSRLACR